MAVGAAAAKEMEGGAWPEGNVKIVKMTPLELTDENFKPYGQIVGPSGDGAQFGPSDAQLELSRGIPRFYIMRLQDRELKFSSITHHASVSQCLGAVSGLPWYLGVAPASIILEEDTSEEKSVAEDSSLGRHGVKLGAQVKESKAGHFYVTPRPEEVRVFQIDGPRFLKLHVGTWHAGPLFKEPVMDFYNLELSNTNIVDHTTHYFKDDGVIFEIDE